MYIEAVKGRFQRIKEDKSTDWQEVGKLDIWSRVLTQDP